VLARSAHILAYLGHQYDKAAILCEEAVALNSNLALAWHSRGWVTLMCVQPDRAIESFQTMMRLSPLDPLGGVAKCGIAFACFQASRYEEKLGIANKLVQTGAPNAHSFCAYIINAVSLGRPREAADVAARLQKDEPGFRVALASVIFPMRSADMQNKIAKALRDAGVPD
jgi:tetratricopeptide (TPR) repeat protein